MSTDDTTAPAAAGPVERMVRPPRKATIDRLCRLLDEWRREEQNLASHHGSQPWPGSMRAKKVKDAAALQSALSYLLAQRG